jgi:hypothetical protein
VNETPPSHVFYRSERRRKEMKIPSLPAESSPLGNFPVISQKLLFTSH